MSSTCAILPWLRTDKTDVAERKLRMEPADAIDKILPADATESRDPTDPNDADDSPDVALAGRMVMAATTVEVSAARCS